MSLPSSLSAFTLAQARDALKAKTISSRELTGALLKAVEGSRGLNAYVTETPERAVEMAEASDRRIKRGEAGALEGLPLAIKDLFCTKGVKTTAGSRILGNFVPPYESTVTQNLWNAGADFKLTPDLKLVSNVNYMRFVRTEPLEFLLFQSPIQHGIGVDSSLGVVYRPRLSDNIVIKGGFADLAPAVGLRQIYQSKTLLSGFVVITYRF